MDVLTGVAAVSFLAAVFLFFWIRVRPEPKRAAQAGRAPAPRPRAANYMPQDGTPGEARTCPVCAARFELGETVKSKIFPSTGKRERLLHILGCAFCLSGERERKCPVCGGPLGLKEYLIAHIFERPGKSHVHVRGCTRCLLQYGKAPPAPASAPE